MKYVIRQQSRGASVAKHRRPRTGQRHGFGRLVGSLSITYALLVSLIAAPGARAQTAPPGPGAKEPVRNYTIFPSHDIVSLGPNSAPGLFLSVQGYRSDQNLGLNYAFGYGQDNDANQFVAAPGRIWRPESEQVVYARRVNGNNLAVTFVANPPTSGPSHVFTGFQSRLNGSSDFMGIAAGDLDKVPDSQGNNHDEVVVAYASSQTASGGPVNVAVLDYTAPATAPPSPVAVTSAQTSHNLASSFYPGSGSGILAVDNILGVAVGDFDGDGLKEIAVVYISSPTTISVSMFRYTNDGQGNRSLKEVSTASRQARYPAFAGTVSVAAADFDGKGKDELLVGLSQWLGFDDGTYEQSKDADVWQADSNLNLTMMVTLRIGDDFNDLYALPDNAARIQVSPGLFKYDPANGFDLNRRQFVAAWNTPDGNLLLTTYQVSDDLRTITQMNQQVWASGAGVVNQRFSIAAGAYKGNAASTPPLWGIALGAWAASGQYFLSTLSSALTGAGQLVVGSGNVDSSARHPVVAFDLDGKSVQLGPPVHFNIEGLVNTDFVLQEPPKHAFYDNNTASSDYGQIVTVSRYDSTNVALTTSTGTTFSGKSTDTSNWSIGASTAVNAGSSIGGGIGDMVEAEASVDVTAKVGYDYNQNKDNYNSNYGERTVTQTEQTDHDDKLLGRLQTIDIWRYRVYGVAVNDQQGQPANAFYEVILPGPTLPFNGGGLDFDWYQPTYENGNVLSYPQLSNSAFSPADLGSYKIPCPGAPPGPDCNPDGTQTIAAPMIPASQVFFNGTSGKLSLDFKNSTGSGQSFSYSHSLAESLDAKVAVSAKVDAGVANVEGHASVDVELHNNNSWGNTTTSDVTTTSDTGITLSRSSGDSAQAYAFYPVFYSTQDGTIKVTHAADVFSSSTGRSFWASLYGRKPDPALNLPSRFSPTYGPDGTNLTGWTANYYSSRKKLRGFFLRKSTLNPVTNTYDLLASAPLDGQKVRVEANVYNYSTAVAANSIKVRFDVIGYNSDSDTEIPFTSCPAGATLQPQTGRCTIGETTVAQLNALQMTPATITWDTTGFGPTQQGASSDYRVYVVLDPDNTIDEKYDTEDPTKDYPCKDGNGNTCAPPADGSSTTGVDPGQNNEGFGSATVMHPSVSSAPVSDILTGAAPSSPAFGADVSLRRDSLVAANNRGRIRAVRALARLNRPLPLRLRLYSDTAHNEFSHVLIYDGDPDGGGQMVASKIVHSGNQDGASVWFEWQPRRLGKHTLYARVVEKYGDAQPGNHTDTLEVNVLRDDTTAPQLAITLTPDTLWPADGQTVPITARVSAGDDHDREPEIRLEAITHNDANDASADVTGAEFGTDDRSFTLRAARDGRFGLRERVYEVTYSATDWAGNKTFAKAYVIVPRRPRD